MLGGLGRAGDPTPATLRIVVRVIRVRIRVHFRVHFRVHVRVRESIGVARRLESAQRLIAAALSLALRLTRMTRISVGIAGSQHHDSLIKGSEG